MKIERKKKRRKQNSTHTLLNYSPSLFIAKRKNTKTTTTNCLTTEENKALHITKLPPLLIRSKEKNTKTTPTNCLVTLWYWCTSLSYWRASDRVWYWWAWSLILASFWACWWAPSILVSLIWWYSPEPDTLVLSELKEWTAQEWLLQKSVKKGERFGVSCNLP